MKYRGLRYVSKIKKLILNFLDKNNKINWNEKIKLASAKMQTSKYVEQHQLTYKNFVLKEIIKNNLEFNNDLIFDIDKVSDIVADEYFEKFLKDLSSCREFMVTLLDNANKRKWLTKTLIDKPSSWVPVYKNFCVTVTGLNNAVWKTNSVSLFFEIEASYTGRHIQVTELNLESHCVWRLKLSRVEFIDFYDLSSEDPTFMNFKNSSLDFRPADLNKHSLYSDDYQQYTEISPKDFLFGFGDLMDMKKVEMSELAENDTILYQHYYKDVFSKMTEEDRNKMKQISEGNIIYIPNDSKIEDNRFSLDSEDEEKTKISWKNLYLITERTFETNGRPINNIIISASSEFVTDGNGDNAFSINLERQNKDEPKDKWFNEINKTFEKRINGLNTKIKQIEDEINKKISDRIQCEKDIKAFEQDKKREINALNEELLSVKSDIKEIYENIKDIDRKFEEQILKLENIKAEISSLDKEDKDKYNQQLNNFNKQISEIKEKCKAEKNIFQENRNLKSIEKREKELEKEINATKKAYDEKILSREQRIRELEKDINSNENNKQYLNSLQKRSGEITEYFSKLKQQGKTNIYKISSIRSNKIRENHSYRIKSLYELSKKPNDSILRGDNSKYSWMIEYSDVGTKTKIRRYRIAYLNSIDGFYKNPYLISSLNYNDFGIQVHETTPQMQQIIERYKLNENQKETFKKSCYFRALYFLQGPPGTGKTQTICSVIDYQTQNDKNVVVTSSTHEAINNCMERFDSINNTNPNNILLKFAKTNDDEKNKEIFNVDNLYKNFIGKIYKHINKVYLKNDDSDFSNFEKYYEELIPIDLILLVMKEKEYLFKLYKLLRNNNDELLAKFKSRFTSFVELLDMNTEFADEKWNINPSIEAMFSNHYPKSENKNQGLNSLIRMHANYLSSKIKKMLDSGFIPLKIGELFSKNNSNEKQNQIFNNFYKKLDLENIPKYSEKNNEFKKYVNKNDLVNVIGLTTTAKTTFTIQDNIERDLLSDYPIDLTIIDEVSKSAAPELISRILVSKKTILCGDYKQLPPNEQMDQIFVEKLLDACETDDRYIEDQTFFQYIDDKIKEESEFDSLTYGGHQEDWDKEQKDYVARKINEDLNNKLNTSLFKTMVMKIKSAPSDSKNKNYSFLKEQHRFTKSINDYVNLFYRQDGEELIAVKSNKHNQEYILPKGRNEIEHTQDVLFIDTTILPDWYLEEFKKNVDFSIKDIKESFDQKTYVKMDKLNFDLDDKRLKSEGLFNQYNAYVIYKYLKEFCKLNSNKNIDLKNNIGVIALTGNQKIIIRELIKKDEQLKQLKIKVDTIDNFQGREKDIIIVDLVRSKHKIDGSYKEETDSSRNLDFLMNDERLNVAFSRPRDKLIIVGSHQYYSKALERNKKSLLKKYLMKKDADGITMEAQYENYKED
ncbi:AAA domain-containing protein [Mycoplasma seminis]|uniref:AAA domain-containing protein n=1 Tax=Mycoplasma seminis TaxID=512749 RepID=A0ABY9HAF2_9MOLU|nr:AAA domain-containing protein [Mycoplasma seminis]WLP85231.1 AAA domain-containing protein [Mycoplasma seminis]